MTERRLWGPWCLILFLAALGAGCLSEGRAQPDSSRAALEQFQAAEKAFRLQDYQAARTLFEQCLAHHPDRGSLHMRLARCYREQGDEASYLEHLRLATQFVPYARDAYRELASHYWQKEEREVVAQYLRLAADSDKAGSLGVTHLAELALVCEEQGNLKAALVVWQEVLEHPSQSEIARQRKWEAAGHLAHIRRLLARQAPQALTPTVPVEAVDFPQTVLVSDVWSAMGAGRDGSVYVGTSTNRENVPAALCRLRPGAAIMEVAFFTDECIRDAEDFPLPHGKIHTQLYQGFDGKIYGATHTNVHDREREHEYAGGHWFSYDPETGEAHDLGLAAENEGVIALAISPDRKTLYGLACPSSRIVVYDIAERRASVKGPTITGDEGVSRVLFVLADGNVYTVDGADSSIVRYDPATDTITDLPLFTPHETEGEKLYNYWHSGVVFPDGYRFAATAFQSGHFFVYDCRQGEYGEVRDLGRTIPDWEEEARWRPFSHGMAWGGDGKLYLAVWSPKKAAYETTGTYMVEYDPETDRLRNLGLLGVADEPDWKVTRVTAATSLPDGRIALAGKVKKQQPFGPEWPVVFLLDPTSWPQEQQ